MPTIKPRPPTIPGLFLLAAFWLGLSAPVGAMWFRMSDAELLAQSDLVATGEIAEARPDGRLVLRIAECLKGCGAFAQALLAGPAAGAPRSSTDLIHHVGQKGLWLLRAHPQAAGEALYLADHPQRFVPADQAGRIQLLRGLLASPPK